MPKPESPWIGRERRDLRRRNAVVHQVLAEYQQFPGLSLTAAQAARLFALRPDVSLRIFEELVQAGLLRRTLEARYIRKRTAGAL